MELFILYIAGYGLNLTDLKNDFSLRAHAYLTGADIEMCSQNALSNLKVITRNTT
jgi:hypothetical protein